MFRRFLSGGTRSQNPRCWLGAMYCNRPAFAVVTLLAAPRNFLTANDVSSFGSPCGLQTAFEATGNSIHAKRPRGCRVESWYRTAGAFQVFPYRLPVVGRS